MDDLKIRLRRGAYDHLGALPGGHKSLGIPVQLDLLPVFLHFVLHKPHGRKDPLSCLVGRKEAQSLCCRQFQIDAHPVRQKSQPLQQFLAGAGNSLHMDVALESVCCPQLIEGRIDKLHCMIRTFQHTRAQKQAFYVIAPVKFHRQCTDLVRRKGGPGHIVAPSVNAVFAVIDALICKQDLQQGNASPVRGEAVAYPRLGAAPYASAVIGALGPAGRAGHVIFGRVSQYFQFVSYGYRLLKFHDHTSPLNDIEHTFLFQYTNVRSACQEAINMTVLFFRSSLTAIIYFM